MPDINPLTNNQIFLKKIAENTGSNYETGDVSEINPITIDQIFLKEIAANTAEQARDITELEGKVADNTAAIEAIENVTENCSRYLDLSKYSSTSLTTDYVNRHSWTCPADGAYFFRTQNDSDGSHAIKLTLYVGSSNNEIFNHNSNTSEDLYVCIDSPVFYLKKDTEIQYLSDRSTGGNGGGTFVIRLN